MADWNIGERVTEMLAALEASADIEVVVSRRAPPISQAEVDAIVAELGWTLDHRFLEFFRAQDGLRLVWIDARHVYDDVAPDARPWERYQRADELAAAGSIFVPCLRDVVFDQGGFDSATVEPGEYRLDTLGGWDDALLRARMRPFDDYEDDLDFGSFNLPAVLIDALYPHPPVLFASDYMAGFGDHNPCLGADYLDFVVATLGDASCRKRRLGHWVKQGVDMFVPREGWLDGAPEAVDVAAAHLGRGSSEVSGWLERVCDEPGVDPRSTPFAHYVDSNLRPETKELPAGLVPWRRLRKSQLRWDERSADFRRVLAGLPGDMDLALPTLDPAHYEVESPMRPVPTFMPELRGLVGQVVKYRRGTYRGSERVACLLAVEPGRAWIYRASMYEDGAGALRFGSYGFNQVPFSELEWIGRAVAIV